MAKKFKCGKNRSKVAKRKLVTNISQNSSLTKGCDLCHSKVAKEDFGPVGVLNPTKPSASGNEFSQRLH
jgi:hypothetical protein